MPPSSVAKEFLVKVEINIRKISCPGVWLCSNGKISMQLFMLGSSIQTDTYKPCFPVKFNEKFIFRKTFSKERRLNELHRSLNNEWFYAELIQWKNCDEGYVLAFFQTTLDDLLYPSSNRSSNTGSEVDLLMEPTKLFPGTIAPKLELCTKTTIEEVFNEFSNVEIPTTLSSTLHQARRTHPRAVCHTTDYSRAQQQKPLKSKSKRPIFKYVKPKDDFPPVEEAPQYQRVQRKSNDTMRRSRLREPILEESGNNCYCQCTATDANSRSSVLQLKPSTKKHEKHTVPSYECCKRFKKYYCPICSKYECYFFCPRNSNENPASRQLCSYCQNLANFHINYDESCCESEVSESKKRVCFCLPQRKTENLVRHLNERVRRSMSSVQNCVDCYESEESN